mmetsp:Transcript_29610/g.61807  ORF Transcript_29610/g.61807 Transcript_29610/m.61807 type:complete len:93 (+) Transcript_29610:709-987(+)
MIDDTNINIPQLLHHTNSYFIFCTLKNRPRAVYCNHNHQHQRHKHNRTMNDTSISISAQPTIQRDEEICHPPSPVHLLTINAIPRRFVPHGA